MRSPIIYGITSGVAICGVVFASLAVWGGGRPLEHRAAIVQGGSESDTSRGGFSVIEWTPPKARNPTPIAPLEQVATQQAAEVPPTVGTSRAEAETMQVEPPKMPQIRKEAHDVCQATGGEKLWFKSHGRMRWKCAY
jgi:hypothetical protein